MPDINLEMVARINRQEDELDRALSLLTQQQSEIARLRELLRRWFDGFSDTEETNQIVDATKAALSERPKWLGDAETH